MPVLRYPLVMSPMLYVQIGIGNVTMPALVDNGASSNFIDQGVADALKLHPLPLKVPTKKYGQPMAT